MLCVDVNVLVDAFLQDAAAHEAAFGWLDSACDGTEPVLVTTGVAAAFVRVVTNRRLWKVPASPDAALAFIAALETSPVFRWHQPGQPCWGIFTTLVSDLRLSGNDIPDAYLAATALEAGATLVTSDRGFTRFRSLRLLDPTATA